MKTATPMSIAPRLANVVAHAEEFMALYEQDRAVIEIPEGTAAYHMGYRFTTCLVAELPDYLAGGAKLAAKQRKGFKA